MFVRAFGLSATVGLLASVAGHLLKLADVPGIDPFRWIATAATVVSVAALAMGIAYQRLRRAHLRKAPQHVVEALGPVPAPAQELDELLCPLVTSGRTAGVVVAVQVGDRTGFRAYADPERSSLDERTVFEIGSITKTFTALLLAEMTLAGEVELEAPVGAHVEELRGSPIQDATLLDLATHRSGLPRLPLGMLGAVFARSPDPYARWDEARLVAAARRARRRSTPAAPARYSNLGFALLGLALSRAAGARYGELIRERICLPLGMTDTHVGEAEAHRGRIARGHDAFGGVTSNWNMAAFAPAGGIRSTAADMGRYLAAQLDPDSTSLADAIRLAQQPRRDFPSADRAARSSAPSRRIGLAWISSSPGDGRHVIWHNGGTGGYGSFIGFEPAHDAGIVALSNSTHGRRLDSRCLEILPLLRAPRAAVSG